MPTPAEVEDFQSAMDDVRTLMVAALVTQWLESTQGNPADAVDDLRSFVLEIVAEYGQVAAATAIDFYDSVRPAGSPSFAAVPVVRDDLIGGGSLNWSTAPLLTDEWEKSLDRMAAEMQKATFAAAVETIGQATDEDPLDARFARWPMNSQPCAYCVLRASRGAVYWSEATAERGDHVSCGCRVTPIFPGERLPYQLKPYKQQYLDGAADADGFGLKSVLAGMRRANGSR